MSWESAEKVQKNSKGEYRAMINGAWIPVSKAQKNSQGQYRVDRDGGKDDATEQTQPRDISQIDTTLTPLERASLTVDETAANIGNFASGLFPKIVRPFLPDRQDVVDFAAGASGLMRGGANLIKPELGQKIWPTSGANEESAARTIGSIADPVSLAIGGGVSKLLPYTPVLGKGLAGGVKAVGKNVTAGTITGGAIGGLSENGTAEQGAAFGAALSIALPAAITSGKYVGKRVGEIADLIMPGGAKRISDRYVNSIIGEQNKGTLAKALASPDEYVVGSKPTAAEVVSHLPEGSPIQAHQKLVSQEPGGISAQFGKNLAEKKATRDAALSFAGTEDEMQKLITERTNAVNPLYDAVKKSKVKVNVNPVLTVVDSVLKENPNRTVIASPLISIRDKLVTKTKMGPSLENNPQRLKSLSDEIGDMMGKKNPSGQPEYDVKVLREVKEVLDKQIGLFVPEFKKAQNVFIEKSKPINVMQIGQALKAKLTNPTGAETPGTYLKALDNERKLLKDSIGFGRKGIEDYLSPEQMRNVQNVAKDLERQIASNKPLQSTNLRGGVDVAGENTISLPNLLSRPAMIANYVIKGLGRNVEPEIDAYLSYLYRNPKELSKVIEQIPQSQRKLFLDALKPYGRAAIISASQNQ